MGFFNNMKNIKDHALEIDSIKNIDELQVVFDKIDDKAEEETEKKERKGNISKVCLLKKK